MTITKQMIKKQRLESHQVDKFMTLLGFTGVLLSTIGVIHNEHIVLKIALGIVDMDSALLAWWAVQDLYFYYKRKFIASKASPNED